MKTGEVITTIAVVGLIITNIVVIVRLNKVQTTFQPFMDKLEPIENDIQTILTKLKSTGVF